MGIVVLVGVTLCHATDPPQNHGLKSQGFVRLVPIEIGPHYESPRIFQIPAKSIRQMYDSAGLPVPRKTDLRDSASALRWSPPAFKRHLLERGCRINWERWAVAINNTPAIKWTASVAGGIGTKKFLPPFDGVPVWRYNNWNLTPQFVGSQGLVRGSNGFQMDTRHLWQEHFQHRRYPGYMIETPQRVMNPGQLRIPSGGIVSWTLRRMFGGWVKPKPKLAHLKELAPFMYDHIPDYILERAEWFDHYYVTEVAVMANDKDGPHTLEIIGSFAFENEEHGYQFDDYFDPSVFRRIHCHVWDQYAIKTIQPGRKADVLVIHDKGGPTRIRFLVDARYDPQPEFRRKMPPTPKPEFKTGDIAPDEYSVEQLKQDLLDNRIVTVSSTPFAVGLGRAATYRVFQVNRKTNGLSLLAADSNHYTILGFDSMAEQITKWHVK